MNRKRSLTITDWVHQQLLNFAETAECCVDATAGNGNDTLFLCEHIPREGRVFAFDIQKEALEHTGKLLEKHGYLPKGFEKKENENSRIRLILDSHVHMDQYLMPKSVDVMMFNLGYLPGGDHTLATRADTTIAAVKKGLMLLKDGGMMSICIYSGGDSGFAERDALLPFLKELDAEKYTVIAESFYNKPNHPPIPVLIRKEG